MSDQEKNEQDKNQDYQKYSSGTVSDYEKHMSHHPLEIMVI
jgi:hypothetical protein